MNKRLMKIYIPLKSGHHLPIEVMKGLIDNNCEPICISSHSNIAGLDRQNKFNNLVEAMRLCSGDFISMDRDIVLEKLQIDELIEHLRTKPFVYYEVRLKQKHGLFGVKREIIDKYPITNIDNYETCVTCQWMKYLEKKGIEVKSIGRVNEIKT